MSSDLNITNIGMVLIFLPIVMTLLPGSPFSALFSYIQQYPMLEYICYFLPIQEFIAFLQAWITAVAAYYAVSLLARWIGLIQ